MVKWIRIFISLPPFENDTRMHSGYIEMQYAFRREFAPRTQADVDYRMIPARSIGRKRGEQVGPGWTCCFGLDAYAMCRLYRWQGKAAS
jgi:hypothetical protein